LIQGADCMKFTAFSGFDGDSPIVSLWCLCNLRLSECWWHCDRFSSRNSKISKICGFWLVLPIIGCFPYCDFADKRRKFRWIHSRYQFESHLFQLINDSTETHPFPIVGSQTIANEFCRFGKDTVRNLHLPVGCDYRPCNLVWSHTPRKYRFSSNQFAQNQSNEKTSFSRPYLLS
jgi:hypothetical protein